MNLNREFTSFKQEDWEVGKEYVARFSTLECKVRNEKAGMSNMFLASHLLNNSNLTKAEKSNKLSTVNLEDDVNILKDIKKRLRDLCSSESKKSEGSLSTKKDKAEKDLTQEDHLRIEERLKNH